MKKLIIILILVAGAIGVTFALKPKQIQAPSQTNIQQDDSQIPGPFVFNDYVAYEGKDGKNALELLEAVTKVETKKFDFGTMVTSINGVTPGKEHFWKLYINTQESAVGADSLQTKNGDIIEWKLEAVK